MHNSEEIIKRKLESQGFTVLKGGWPDFLVIDKSEKRIFAVEVKTKDKKLSKAQKEVTEYLSRLFIPVYVLNPEHNINKEKFVGIKLFNDDEYNGFKARIYCKACIKNKNDSCYAEEKLLKGTAKRENKKKRIELSAEIDKLKNNKHTNLFSGCLKLATHLYGKH